MCLCVSVFFKVWVFWFGSQDQHNEFPEVTIKPFLGKEKLQFVLALLFSPALSHISQISNIDKTLNLYRNKWILEILAAIEVTAEQCIFTF